MSFSPDTSMTEETASAETTGTPAVPMPEAFDRIAGWNTAWFDEIASTSDAARQLPPWHAVLAGRQSAGRGQYHRTFVSDAGGLFLSAVVPTPGGGKAWVGFSLAVGWALLSALRRWRVGNARLRWPNDLMVGSRKLGGILIEQASRDTMVVGIGINLTNRPWLADAELLSIATRVADATQQCPAVLDAAADVLKAVRIAHHEMRTHGLDGLQHKINECWGEPRRIELDLGDERRCEGRFGGIDDAGRLLVWTGSGTLRTFAAHHVHRLRELPEDGGDMYSSRG